MSESESSHLRTSSPSIVALTGNPQNDAADDVKRRSRIRVPLVIAVLLPAIVAFGLLYKEAVFVPYQDDYGVILAFATDYSQLPSMKAKVLDVVTKQNNDYKLAFEHFVVAAEMELTGHLNFTFLVTLGNLLLLPIAYLLWRTYQAGNGNLNQRLIEFVPISILFFSLTYWESLNWAMSALQNLSVILFSFLAIHLLIPRRMASLTRPLLLLACLSSTVAALCSANGFLLAPIGLLILLRRRAFTDSLVWSASFALPVAAYLYHYMPYKVSVQIMHTASYLSRLFYFFAFLGCAIPFRWMAALLGIMISAVIVVAAQSRFERINPVAFYFTVWIVATAFLVEWLREAIPSRYSIYSILLLIFCYSFLSQYLSSRSIIFNRRRFYITSIVLAVILSFVSDLNAYLHLSGRRQLILSGLDHYRVRPEVNSPMIDPAVAAVDPKEEEFERVTLTTAIQRHIYTLAPKQ